MISFFIYFSFIFVVSYSLKIIAAMPNPENKKESLYLTLYQTIFIPLFIPSIFSGILTFIQKIIFTFYKKFETAQAPSIFSEIWIYSTIELFIICAIALFLGSWKYSTKKGGRDSRYKNNPYIYIFSDKERKVAKKILTIPAIALLLYVSFTLLKLYNEKT
ncbi:hypothetical protein P3G55_18360 [Leptospira sp. 96542]|nr:hypothetical protein [Leptospira sp. 96542]